jgi:tetratricopeptide (TPR) repeat protein
MATINARASAAIPTPTRLVRRRWLWLLLAVAVLLAGGGVGLEGWAYWQERCAGTAVVEEHFDEAHRRIDLALLVRDRWTSTHLLAARVDRLRGAYSEAEQHLSRCEQLNGMSEQVQLEWLLLRCQQGEADELSPNLLALVDRQDPESAAILETLASVYMRQSRYLEALRCLDRWAELAPDSFRVLDWRGWVSNQLDHRGQAIDDYQKALELQPERWAVRLRLAQILIDSSREAEAAPHLELLRAEQPTNSEVLVALARCRMAQARTDDARELLDTVLASHAEDFDALLQRGKLEMQNSQFAEAERWLRKALEQSAIDPEARYTLYLCLQAQGNRQDEAARELARWKQDRQSRDRLTRLLRTELDRKPNDPDLAEEAGKLFLDQGKDQLGVYWLERALALDPGRAACYRALIAYYERTNNPAKAAEHRQQLNALGRPR